MPLTLPAPREAQLTRSPLTLAVCQVRFSPTPAATELATGEAVQRALGGAGEWQLDRVEERTLSLGPEPAARAVEETAVSWQVSSRDGAWVASLSATAVGLESTLNLDWPVFAGRFAGLLAVVAREVAPAMATRLGVRYINRIEDPLVTSPGGWAGWIRDEALGILRHPALAGGLVDAQQQVALDAGDGLRATIRHGCVRDADREVYPYVLDIDSYLEGARAFEPAALGADIQRLYLLGLQLFQSMLTDKLYRYLT